MRVERYACFYVVLIAITQCARQAPQQMPAVQADTLTSQGIGAYANLTVPDSIDRALAERGATLFLKKCASCHNLTGDRLVGPGWQGVTNRRSPAWVMNFLTNVDEMIDKDPDAQVLMENCLVRMPDPNVSDTEARALLEFMRRNDRMPD